MLELMVLMNLAFLQLFPKQKYLIFLFESDPLSSEELSNPCEGIDELLYVDFNDTNPGNSTRGLIDIKTAMATPGKTYI